MDTSNVSPVTEDEVRNLAERLCTMIVAHSKQDEQIGNLTNQVNDLSQRVRQATDENSQLRNDIRQSDELADSYSKERDEARRTAETERDRANELQNLILARDSKVNELVQKVQDLTRSNDNLATTNRQQESRIESLLRRNDELVHQNDDLTTKLNVANTANAKAQEDLRKLQETFKAVFAQAMPQVEAPKADPIPQPETTKAEPWSPPNAPEMKPVIQDEGSDYPWSHSDGHR